MLDMAFKFPWGLSLSDLLEVVCYWCFAYYLVFLDSNLWDSMS